MSYIDKIYLLNHTDGIVKSCRDDSTLSHYRTTRIPHPQKRKAECLKVTLNVNEHSEFKSDKINLYVDDFELIKVTNGNDSTIMESENSCFTRKFFVNFLIAYMKKQFELHGDKYIEDAKATREKNKDLLKIAKKHAENVKQNLLHSISTSAMDKNLNMHQVKKDICYYSDIIECLDHNIKSQNNVINCLNDIQNSNQSVSN